MKTFQCTHCGSLVFFNDFVCVQCQHALGFDAEALTMLAVAPETSDETQGEQGASPLWRIATGAEAGQAADDGRRFRFCLNHTDHRACNFLVAADDPQVYCVSCRQTRVIPNLSTPGNLWHWSTIEHAKRRLYYSLAKLGLESGVSGGADVQTPVYEFLEDVPGEDPVMTGHANGLITINIAEADDAERIRRRTSLHEPYRTLLGHLRHEVGHYYWDQFFLGDPAALDAFRQMFGDEQLDYGQALQRHYESPRSDWQTAFVSSYATAHPWEDWAETWAHYLHMTDLLETAAAYRLSFTPGGLVGQQPIHCADPYAAMDALAGDAQGAGATTAPPSLTALLNQGMGVSLVLNSLNRSLGQEDAYPFALSTPVLNKLAFVHDIVWRKRRADTQAAGDAPPAQA